MHFLIFLGSVRDSTPPRPARLGLRVTRACTAAFDARFPGHTVELVDAMDHPTEPVFKPHFSYSSRNVPQALDELANRIEGADGYIMVSPEYNHSMSPALANLLNHFGSSLFAWKPSAIVTYSVGQWGGLRAAVAMRTYLSELGCLPVSAMVHVPRAAEVLNEDGSMQPGQDLSSWQGYFGRSFAQLIWWAEASSRHRALVDPHDSVADFTSNPSQRNAP